MNAKQRRLVRRGLERMKTEEMAQLMGYDHRYPVAPGVLRLMRRARPRWQGPIRGGGRRDPESYGLRCHRCGRPAYGRGELGMECRACLDEIPF